MLGRLAVLDREAVAGRIADRVGLVVAVRRRWPVPVFLATALASMAYTGLDFPDSPRILGLLVALYTVAVTGRLGARPVRLRRSRGGA